MPCRETSRSGFACLVVLLAALLGGCFEALATTTGGSDEGSVSFRNDVMAVLSKAGCNAGGCHGNRNGRGGFKLSLRGEDPDLDYRTLLYDLAGRRTDPQNPERSLLLLKPTAEVPHEGRQRFLPGSREYSILRRWIADGMKDDRETAPRLERVEVSPRARYVREPERSVQLRATAVFANGDRRDVTPLAVYEASNPLVDVTPGGRVTAREPGESTMLVRYLDQQTPVPLVFVPERPGYVWSRARPRNFIDDHIYSKLRKLRLNPSAPCSDEVFARRTSLDLIGILPTADEAREFVADADPGKRERWVEALLCRAEFSEFWALKWADLLKSEERSLDRKGLQTFHEWIRSSIEANQPLDEFVRQMIAARGSTYAVPPANYHRAHRTPVERAEAAAQVFLGTRLQCAQCHNHPYERWTQDDYHAWAGLFSRVSYKVIENRRRDDNDGHEFIGEQIVFMSAKGGVKHPRTGDPVSPRLLGVRSEAAADGQDYLRILAEWLTAPENGLFARAQVNRIWYHLMGRGLVEPVDDFRSTNPASHPALLDALAAEFVHSGFDLRHMIRLIVNSGTYQLDSEPCDASGDAGFNYSHNVVRRLTAEQLLDCQSQAAGVPLEFQGWPGLTRSAQLPGTRIEGRRRGRATAELDVFLAAFGKPPRQLTTECERSCEPTMSQAFQMIGGPTVHQLITHPENRLRDLGSKPARETIEALYWAALTRPPGPVEQERFTAFLEASTDRRAALEDVLWSLLNSKEFVLRR